MERQTIKRIIGSLAAICLITALGLWLLYSDLKSEGSMGGYVEKPATAAPAAASETPSEASAVPEAENRLELNTATAEELAGLPGIGEVLAARIVAYRQETPFKVVRDLKKVSGIGNQKFKAICDLVYVAEN